ncbi:MAG: FHA domain-containing protein, partial [Candidatus Rokuibacteriota bacterium]
MPWLVLTEDGGAPRVLELTASPFRVGRRAGNDLVLGDYAVSREHVHIERDGPD